MSLALRTRALLDLIEEDQARARAETRASGQREAAEILRAGRAEARAHVRETVAAERARLGDRLGAAEARLANERRQHDQRRAMSLLASAWERLPDELARRWADANDRAAWVRHICEAGTGNLPKGSWTVEHAPGLADRDRAAIAAQVTAHCAVAPSFEVHAPMRAGLRLRCDANAVDGSLDGLLSERSTIEARVLDLLEPAS